MTTRKDSFTRSDLSTIYLSSFKYPELNDTTKTSLRLIPIRRLQGFERALFEFQRKLRASKFKPVLGAAYQISASKIVKCGRRVRLTEAITMDFIRANTTIPVPRVLDVFDVRKTIHIVQEYIEGDVLEDVWNKLNEDVKMDCMHQLKGYIDQMRSLVPPDPGKVQAVDGTGCVDMRLEPGVFGPFDSNDDFNNHFFHEFVREHPDRYPEAAAPLAKTQGRKWRTVFAHGDLGPHNILWKDGKITAIIDWEYAGWFPEYWEYTRTYAARWGTSWWDLFQKVVDQYPDELEVERMLAAYFVRV